VTGNWIHLQFFVLVVLLSGNSGFSNRGSRPRKVSDGSRTQSSELDVLNWLLNADSVTKTNVIYGFGASSHRLENR
jgi:hypothetical protein